jgi:hypothetical protein
MRVTKRDFVKGAAATAVVVATARAARSTPARGFDLAVFNDWFPQARTFAARFAEQGARTLPVAGDAGQLWYGTLRGLIADGQRRIVGLTTHTDLLILETLAREKGLRVSQRENAGRLVAWVLS